MVIQPSGRTDEAQPMETSGWFNQWRVRFTALCAIFMVAGFVFKNDVLSYISVAAGSVFAIQSAWNSLRERSVDVNLLMVLAAIGSIVLGLPLEAAILLFLFSLSSTLESLALAKTQSAVEALIKLRPDTATLITSEGDATVAVSTLSLGDLIRIQPFTQIPIDAEVVEGESSVDQSAMTGESVPVAKHHGNKLIGGTQNLGGMLVARVSAVHGESTLDKIVALVRDAQENKGRSERISAWFGQRYTLIVIAAFAASFAIRLGIGEPLQTAAYSSLTLLVALSPCALVISTPASTLSALAWAARNGMLVRGGEFIEVSGTIQALAVDKTGTLTAGRHELVEICMCAKPLIGVGGGSTCVDESNCWHGEYGISGDAREVLRLTAIAESSSNHPIGDAICRAAKAQGIDIESPTSVQVHPGLGVVATVGDRQVAVGKLQLFDKLGVQFPSEFVDHLNQLRKSGATVAIMNSGELVAGLALRDEPRHDSEVAIREFQNLGIDPIVMITGDTHETARAVAERVGILEVSAELLPAQKVEIVRKLQSMGKKTMMIGDGVNDAPSLAVSDLGVAMGGLGSDIALNTAHVVLMRDDLLGVAQLIRLGKKTNAIITANLVFAAGVIAMLTVSSLFLKLPLPLAVVGHEGSTVIVILNGLRLLRGPGALSARVS